MATQPQKAPVTIYNEFTEETITLDEAYFVAQREAIREFLAHPWTDEELAWIIHEHSGLTRLAVSG